MVNEKKFEERFTELRSELKTERLDMSFGEIMNIYKEGMLVIQPEYQRSYRWNDEQKTRFIESILLGIPIPPIFVAEDKEGKWELVDGLQRISTILSFFGMLANDKEAKNYFKLTKSDLFNNMLENVDVNILPIDDPSRYDAIKVCIVSNFLMSAFLLNPTVLAKAGIGIFVCI